MTVIPDHVYVELDIFGYEAVVLVNGYAVSTEWRRLNRGVLPINQWVVSGENELMVRLVREDGPGILGAEEDEPARWFSVEAGHETAVEEGTLAGDSGGTSLALLGADDDMIDKLLDDQDGELPLEVSTSFNVAAPFPEWRWLQAQSHVELSDDDIAEIGQLLTGLHDAVSRGDIDAVLNAIDLPIGELAAAWGRTRADFRAELEGLYQTQMSEAGFAVEPLALDELEPQLHCEGRVVELVNSDGCPLIRQQPCDEQWIMPLHVGKLDGAWTVVRLA